MIDRDEDSPGRTSTGGPADAREVADIEQLARFLDSQFKLPFGLRVGWDGIIGLVPVVGGLLTTAVSAFIVIRGAMVGAAPSVILRMLFNVLVDNAIAALPLVGWLGDFAWKSNDRNVALLRRHLADPNEVARRSRAYVAAVIAVIVALFVGLAYATVRVALWVFEQTRGLWPEL